MYILRYILTIISVYTAGLVNATNVIKCEDAEGAISYADEQCPAGQTQLRQIKYKEYKAPKNASPKSLEKAAEYPEQGQPLPKIPTTVFQSKLNQALLSVTAVKQGMQEYYLAQGKWPRVLKDLGFEPRDMTTDLILKTIVTTRGQISIKLSKSFGARKEVWFYPKLEMGGTQMKWICYTNFPPSLLRDKISGDELCLSRYF